MQAGTRDSDAIEFDDGWTRIREKRLRHVVSEILQIRVCNQRIVGDDVRSQFSNWTRHLVPYEA